jgi:putative DNA primase/helicase
MQKAESAFERLARKQQENRQQKPRGTRRVLPSPSAPMEVVRKFVEERCLRNGAPEELTLRYWNGGWWSWRTTHWLEVKEQRVRQWLYRFADGAVYYDAEGELKPWSPNKRKVGDLLDALTALIYVPEEVEEQPCWLDGRDGGGPFVSCANGLLDVSTQELQPHTPLYFNQTSVPFDYDPQAPPPEKWLAFLNELWPPSKNGKENPAIAALGEWFGYVVSGRTDLHKIFLNVGPTRGGKGTIARILTALVGKRNTCGPTLNSLGSEFGLAPLIGRSLAVISDVRFTGRNAGIVVERLLSISGEDTLTVNVKYREQWSGKLPSRLHVLSNELPRLGDASAAIVGRLVLLVTQRSWLGKENHKLERELRAELTGILNFSLTGLKRLTFEGEENQFTRVPDSDAALQQMRDLASPVQAFARERCIVGLLEKDGTERMVKVDDLYDVYRAWCTDNELPKSEKALFGRDLRAAYPFITKSRPWAPPKQDRPHFYKGIRLRRFGDDDEDDGVGDDQGALL